MKRISILGSTGSIGSQALQVIEDLGHGYQVLGIAAGRNRELALEQVNKYEPEVLSMSAREDAEWIRSNLNPGHRTKVVWGMEGLISVAAWNNVDIVLTAVSGAIGLSPTIEALKSGKDIALANKETLVAAGGLVTNLARKHGGKIIPVDSEHSAIWQCLRGEKDEQVDKIILTASGGPFRDYKKDELAGVTPEKALKHPNWDMGAKITIDSATLMNKGLEVIEARWLFGLGYEDIEVLIHPQSIIHSMVEFIDGSVISQMGVPDMYLPIQCALTYPERVKSKAPRMERPMGQLTFESPDLERFPCLKLAYDAGKSGGTMPVVLNAANEIAVGEFLNRNLGFMDISSVIESVMERHSLNEEPTLEEIFKVDNWAREEARKLIYNN